MTLLEQWHEIAYDTTDQKAAQKVWEKYFLEEKEIYKKLLADVDTEISGTVSELAEKYGMDIVYFAGFLEGIDESITKSNNVEKLKESSKVKIKIVKEELYKNMIRAKASWLYELKEWDNILDKSVRDEFYHSIKSESIVRREGDKVYPNDPCPCGSGKKYKKCCMNKAS